MQIVRVTEFGDTMRVCVYTMATRWDTPEARRCKGKWKRDAWQKHNFRTCREKLEARIACNFIDGDWHAVFTISDQWYTTDYKVLRKYWRRFLRALRQSRAARGAAEPVYIYCMEGLHGDKRLHIHALLRAEEGDIEEYQRCWPYGEVLLTRLEDFAHRDNLAQYLTKEPAKLGRDRMDRNLFVASHNCAKPLTYGYRMPDGAVFQIPEGYRLERDSELVTNGYGNFLYYHLRRIL